MHASDAHAASVLFFRRVHRCVCVCVCVSTRIVYAQAWVSVHLWTRLGGHVFGYILCEHVCSMCICTSIGMHMGVCLDMYMDMRDRYRLPGHGHSGLWDAAFEQKVLYSRIGSCHFGRCFGGPFWGIAAYRSSSKTF